MPLSMDVHNLGDGVSMDDVAKAHQADLATQGEHDVSYLRYWVDERKGQIFCLVETPDAGAATEVHRKAHGLVADSRRLPEATSRQHPKSGTMRRTNLSESLRAALRSGRRSRDEQGNTLTSGFDA